jgi:hypothetical protein
MRSAEDLASFRRLRQKLTVELNHTAGEGTIAEMVESLRRVLDGHTVEKPEKKRRQKGGYDRAEHGGEERGDE